MSNVSLFPVQASQLEALKEYVVALYEHSKDLEAMKNIEEGVNSLIRNPNLATAYFILEADQRRGYTILTKYYSVEKGGVMLFIDELFVEESFRRKGFGSAVMEKILEIAADQGVKGLWAQTEDFNVGASKFFSAHGFSPNSLRNFERPL